MLDHLQCRPTHTAGDLPGRRCTDTIAPGVCRPPGFISTIGVITVTGPGRSVWCWRPARPRPMATRTGGTAGGARVEPGW